MIIALICFTATAGCPSATTVGLSQIANLYNDNMAHHHGKLTAVIASRLPTGRWVQDYERGVGGGISPASVADRHVHWRLVL